MTAPLAFDPDGRPPIELARLYRERSGTGAPAGTTYVGAAGEALTVVFVAAGSAPCAIPVAAGVDAAPACHPYADLTGWPTVALVGSIGTTDVPAGGRVAVEYTPAAAAGTWEPLGCVLDVSASGDIIGPAVSVPAGAQRPVWLRLVGA